VSGRHPPEGEAAGTGELGDVLEMPAASRSTDIALDELELVYAFIYARVGNRADTEDLTQQVAMKAIPRLRQGAPASAIRGYLFATARSVLGGFWSSRLLRLLPQRRTPRQFTGSSPSSQTTTGGCWSCVSCTGIHSKRWQQRCDRPSGPSR
jgi:hypothetical protein